MSMFRPNSYWTSDTETPQHQVQAIRVVDDPGKIGATPGKIGVDVQQLEDWVARLRTAADEAQDEKLLPLESDLLDLRDAILRYI